MNKNSWVREANCRGKSSAVFFPDHRIMTDNRWDEARAICSDCMVRQQCLDIAIVYEDTDDRWGMFGALTPPERAKLRAELKEMMRRGWE